MWNEMLFESFGKWTRQVSRVWDLFAFHFTIKHSRHRSIVVVTLVVYQRRTTQCNNLRSALYREDCTLTLLKIAPDPTTICSELETSTPSAQKLIGNFALRSTTVRQSMETRAPFHLDNMSTSITVGGIVIYLSCHNWYGSSIFWFEVEF